MSKREMTKHEIVQAWLAEKLTTKEFNKIVQEWVAGR